MQRYIFYVKTQTFSLYFFQKIMPKKQKIAELCFYFEFQVVVAVVGFKWHERGKAKNAD
ncbi:hypothetical protein HMPREF0653_00571 [Prevotella disiens JCM 6334 = ATCC 29426]|nr:hypothetical protein HMPREF0653_00571 [Prevotella disiens JCM 6334 = ATCC 29426]